jgi:hypothetical protein
MTGWEFLYRLGPGWPGERQWVTIGLFGSFWAMLQMAVNDPALWNVKLFEVVFQAIALTGILNMVVAFFYAANKGDEARAVNTGKAFDAIKAAQEAPAPLKRGPFHLRGQRGDHHRD